VRYSLCRLNPGPGGEDPDEPPDCLYGLQVRGPLFSLGGSIFWGAVGGFGLGGSALLFADFSVVVVIASLQCDYAGWLLAIGQQVGADGPGGVGRSIGCGGAQSCGPNHGQVVYRVMSRPVVSMLGDLECWVTFSPRAQRWLQVVS